MYSVELQLCKDFNYSTKLTESFNINDFISCVQDAMLKFYEIPPGVNVRIWGCSQMNASKLVPLDVDKTLKDEKISNGQYIVLETQKPDGSWRHPHKTTSFISEKVIGHSGLTKPGLCGLVNLGNTCFMNSVLQCLSHCPPLSEYFLNNNYLNDLKPDGMEVDLCKAFGELLKVMWSGEYVDVSPNTFKWKVGRYAAQFVGYQQHDAQEFLTFLLDGLNEAINRAKKENKPPPSEANHTNSNSEKESPEKPDQELARETWESYLRKSDSIIVDTFHGLLKSSVVCPVCETVSVKFDPLCYMTLPLPQDSDCVLKVLHVPYDQNMKTVVYRITASKYGTVRDVITKVAERLNKNPESFILAEIINNHFHRFFSLNDSVDKIDRVGNNLMVYDVPITVNDSQYTVAPVCHWESNDGLDSSGHSSHISYTQSNLFGVPFIVVLPATPCTYETVYNLICERIGRYVSKKSDMCSGESMNMDSENGINVNEGLFTLYIVNGLNPNEAKIIPNDGSLLKFPDCLGKQFLALRWTVKSRNEYYKSDQCTYQEALIKPQLKVKLQLQDCLSIFMSTEKLGANNTWNCPKCKVSRRATKKFDLWELPNVLIILLKRFTFNRGGPVGRGMYLDSSLLYREDKLNANVEFPMTNFRLNDYLINKDHPPVSYDLCGVINHYGTLSGGHYTAYAKHKEDKRWYCFDDSRVFPESEDNVMSSSAYILFYIQSNNNTKPK